MAPRRAPNSFLLLTEVFSFFFLSSTVVERVRVYVREVKFVFVIFFFFFFFNEFTPDEENRVNFLFLAHPLSMQMLSKSNKVLCIDATYKTNRF